MSEQQRSISIEHVAAGAEIARRATSDVRAPGARDRWPIKPLAANIRRLAIPGQQAKPSGIALRNLQNRFSEYLKYGARRIGQCTYQLHERAVLAFIRRRT